MPIDDKTDSTELQTLFDSIAASTKEVAVVPAAPESEKSVASASQPSQAAIYSEAGEASDEELQSLFDTVYAEEHVAPTLKQSQGSAEPSSSAPVLVEEVEDDGEPKDMFQQIGQMTRRLHCMLHELGYDEILQKTASTTIPDTRERLQYITKMTEQAAQKVLAATEVASPLVETIGEEAKSLHDRWDTVFKAQVPADIFRQLAQDTKVFLDKTQERSNIARAQLLDIMMAQDFQDLTGQVIKRVIDLAQELESQLLIFLIDNIPTEKREEAEGLMNGPVINPTTRDDVVTNQIQVDDLLESLGF